MRRVLITSIAAVSFLLFIDCLLIVIARCTWDANPNIGWNRAAQQWMPVETDADVRRQVWVSAALTPIFGILPFSWLRRFYIEQKNRNRDWQGRCRACRYDLRQSAGCCPECGVATVGAVAAAAHDPNAMPPGTRAMLRLIAVVVVGLVLIYLLIWIIGFMTVAV